MSELNFELIEAYYGSGRTDPEIDRERPLSIALFGTVSGREWRAHFTEAAMGARPIDWYDPRDTFEGIDNPSHYIPELEHMHDDIRIMAILGDTLAENSLLELSHLLALKMHKPLILYFEHEAEDHAGTIDQVERSERLRAWVWQYVQEYVDNGGENLYVAHSIEDAVTLTKALVSYLQPMTTANPV